MRDPRGAAARIADCPAVSEVITALGLAVFAVCGVLFINSDGLDVYPGPGGITWQTLPVGYSWALLALALLYLVQSLIKLRTEIASYSRPARSVQKRSEARTIFLRRTGTIVFLIVYIALLGQVGFAIATPLFLLALLRLYQRGSLGGDIAISVSGGLILWLLFVPLLKLNLRGEAFDPVTPALQRLLSLIGA